MILSYIITALRAFKLQKQHFALNVFGLSVGLAAAILVALLPSMSFPMTRSSLTLSGFIAWAKTLQLGLVVSLSLTTRRQKM